MSDTVHTYPLNDLVEHEVDGADCVCGPTVEFVDPGWHVTHHSLDGRERFEDRPPPHYYVAAGPDKRDKPCLYPGCGRPWGDPVHLPARL